MEKRRLLCRCRERGWVGSLPAPAPPKFHSPVGVRGRMLSCLTDFMAGLRCQSQSARARGLKTGKTHPKGFLHDPSLGESSPGRIWPRGAGGDNAGAGAQLWVQTKQFCGSTPHGHRSPQDMRGCTLRVRGRQREHPQDPAAQGRAGFGEGAGTRDVSKGAGGAGEVSSCHSCS